MEDLELDAPLDPVRFLPLLPMTPNEAAWKRVHGAPALQELLAERTERTCAIRRAGRGTPGLTRPSDVTHRFRLVSWRRPVTESSLARCRLQLLGLVGERTPPYDDHDRAQQGGHRGHHERDVDVGPLLDLRREVGRAAAANQRTKL